MVETRRIFSSPGFLAALALLLANDWLFKPAFHNGLTGKLSDFAGLFAFSLFWTALFPRYKTLIFSATAVFFACWKMPLSQPLLDAWNNTGFWPLGRVVDPTDLWALLALPMAWLYAGHARPQGALPPLVPTAVALLAFAATSLPRTVEVYNQPYVLDFPEPVLRERLLRDSMFAYLAAQLTPDSPDTLRFDLNLPAPVSVFAWYALSVQPLDSARTLLTLHTGGNRIPATKSNRSNLRKDFEYYFLDRIKNP